jgi:hypothetical protein
MRRILLSAIFVGSLSVAAYCQTATDQQAQQPAASSQATAQPATQASTDQPAPPKKKAKRVYTSEDMKAADPNDIPSPASSSSGGGAAGASADAAAGAGKDDKSSKSKKTKKIDPDAVAAQQAKVDEAKKQVDGLTGIVANLQRLINDQPSRAQTIGEGLQMQQNNLVDAKKQLADEQAQLDAMKNPK